jgi:hypothetical protein
LIGWQDRLWPEGKFLVTKFEFGRNFCMSSEGDCHELKVTPNLELYDVGGSLTWALCISPIQAHT